MSRTLALVVAGCVLASCASLRAPSEDAGRLRTGPKQDPDAAACAGGDARACGRRGVRALTGDGVPQDDRDAATWLIFACEVGDPQSCGDLAALYAAGRGVRRDDRRACALGLAEACARIGAPAPAVARQPSVSVVPAMVVPEPAEEVDDKARDKALAYVAQYVPASQHDRLGVTKDALSAVPPIGDDDLPYVQRLVAARRPEVEACVPAPARAEGGDAAAAFTATAPIVHATFVVSADGRTRDVRTTLAEGGEAAKCVEQAIARWEFPRLEHGGRVLFTIEPKGPAKPEDAAACASGCRAPREQQPGCVARTFRFPAGQAGFRAPQPTRVAFRVAVDGTVSDAFVLDPVPLELAGALRGAVQACAFAPGADASGKPVAAEGVVALRFEGKSVVPAEPAW